MGSYRQRLAASDTRGSTATCLLLCLLPAAGMVVLEARYVAQGGEVRTFSVAITAFSLLLAAVWLWRYCRVRRH